MMRILPKSVERLIESFSKLPGIGPKTAGRLTFYLLHVPQHQLDAFAEAVVNLKRATVYCSICSNIGEQDPCDICATADRDAGLVCVVEQPIDVLSIEKTGKYGGVYHVLHGSIDPLNNIGPDEIRIGQLINRVRSGKIHEVLLATNPTMEGEATAMYIKREIANLTTHLTHLPKIVVSRLAHGLPVGGDVEYADEVTLARAIEGRRDY